MKRYWLFIFLAGTLLSTDLYAADDLLLKGKVEPGLAGIKSVSVAMPYYCSDPNVDVKWLKGVEQLTVGQIGEQIAVLQNNADADAPKLRFEVDILPLENGKALFQVQTVLSRMVILPGAKQTKVRADVWRTEPVMMTVAFGKVRQSITDVISDQAKIFNHSVIMSNPKNLEIDESDGEKNGRSLNGAATVQPIVSKKCVEPKYAASKTTRIFHKSDCKAVKRIDPDNLVFYNSQQEAEKDGKKPCKLCKP